jgi:hypothetical protein
MEQHVRIAPIPRAVGMSSQTHCEFRLIGLNADIGMSRAF